MKKNLKSPKDNLNHDRAFERKVNRLYGMTACFVLVLTAMITPAYADGDPLAVINNLSDFIFSLIRAVGMILLGFGVLQVGMSLKSHDPLQAALLSFSPKRFSRLSLAVKQKTGGCGGI